MLSKRELVFFLLTATYTAGSQATTITQNMQVDIHLPPATTKFAIIFSSEEINCVVETPDDRNYVEFYGNTIADLLTINGIPLMQEDHLNLDLHQNDLLKITAKIPDNKASRVGITNHGEHELILKCNY